MEGSFSYMFKKGQLMTLNKSFFKSQLKHSLRKIKKKNNKKT